jgi:hypothetical protein
MAEHAPNPPEPNKSTDPHVGQWTPPPAPQPVREIGGRKDGPEPTRYGDWEKNGRCIDF